MPVYMIQAGDGGPVKIGVAKQPLKRLSDLQSVNCARLRIIRMFDGGVAEERRLHLIFAPVRMHNEWFEFTSLMLKGDFGLRPYREEPEDGCLDEAPKGATWHQKATVRFGPDKQGVLLGVLPQGAGKKWRPRSSGHIRTKEYRRFARRYQLEARGAQTQEADSGGGGT